MINWIKTSSQLPENTFHVLFLYKHKSSDGYSLVRGEYWDGFQTPPGDNYSGDKYTNEEAPYWSYINLPNGEMLDEY
jgi:hypothetical protein